MTDKKLTLEDAVRLAEEVVAGNEDYIYTNPRGEKARGFSASIKGPLPKCVNWDVISNKPSCVVGHILWKWGVPVSTLVNRNEEGIGDFPEWFETEEGTAFKFLDKLQSSQDKGISWGESLARAKREVEWTS